MESGNGFYSVDEFRLDAKWLIDPKHLFVGPRIGEGAHAKVYEGKYKNQNVAIKIVHREDTPEEITKREARFAREVAMLSRVQHKNLVKFIGACKEPVMVIVTELLLGGSLRKYLLNMRPRSLDTRVAVGFALDIARAMECLHSHGIIHRDLKPGSDVVMFLITYATLDVSAGVRCGIDVILADNEWPYAMEIDMYTMKDLHIHVQFSSSRFNVSDDTGFDEQRLILLTLTHMQSAENLILTADHKTVKLVDFGLAREESLTEMMTAETGTYRWMAPELYSTVTLRHGEKKHYNHKVDSYSFAIVLWELLHNKLPFEGMSNLQAAYAAAFKNVRPSAENLPEDLAIIITSCWIEDPNARPNFVQIVQMLLHYLSTISPPEAMIPSRIFTSENVVLPPESPGTSSLMAVRDDLGETSKAMMENKPRGFFFCFNQCY
ncbi:hypothetical protein HHK36_025026 [Tetracentron sinense]|uniref:Protein kinase domain-containing protein n=1 Tax=Tetracentron sinense TaxID=13715 RepID=A0A834YLX7_TETSI|nr:hypothetical protein HHK36_025026 [Tetracentron sinense]